MSEANAVADTPKTKSTAGRPPKYVQPIIRRLDALEAEVKLDPAKRDKVGLVTPGEFFKDVICALVSTGNISPADPMIYNMIMSNGPLMWQGYVDVTKAAASKIEA